jgi:VWFA-related protein
MNVQHHTSRYFLQAFFLLLLVCLTASSHDSPTQAPAPSQQPSAGGTIRIGVGLVQTDVTVFDRQGRFVDDLKPDQFELTVDAKPQPIDFFELVSEGSPRVEMTPTKAPLSVPAARRAPVGIADSGRTLLFFLDDWHLSADSIARSRAAILNVIDKDMGPNDRGAVFTASRQAGFLQQLSDNKSVLCLALARLTFMNGAVRDLDRPAMNEAQAAAIEQGDPDILGAFVDATVTADGITNDSQGRSEATEIVRGRASALAHVSAEITARSLASLSNIVQSCAALPGRKLLFLLSDGFVLQPQKADITYALRLVTEAAARAAIVIYTLDARGLVVGLPSASDPQDPRSFATPGGAEPAGSLERGYSDVLATQDGLNALASDTGGRFLKNTNALDAAIVQSIEDASRYYLLGWHVDPDKLQLGKYSSIRITIKDRPDLKVHMRQGSMDLSKLIPKRQSQSARATSSTTGSNNELLKAIQNPWPLEGLPTFLYSGYVYHPVKGYVLDISLQVDIEGVESGAAGAKENAPIEVMGVVANRDGATIDSFKQSLSLPADPLNQAASGKRELIHSRWITLEPGIYQVRVAAWDPKSGRVGSAHQWVDVPRNDALLSPSKKIQLGSIFLKGDTLKESAPSEPSRVPFNERQFSAKRRYAASSLLFFMVQVYNADSSSISMQTKVYRGNQAVGHQPAKPVLVEASGNAGPIFVTSELPLEGLSPGSYVLEVTAADASANAVAKQQVPFWITAK